MPSLFDDTRQARIDDAHRRFVNYETFYFADAAERARFEQDPAQWCGWITDPVANVRFVPDARSPHSDHGNRIFYFTSDSARAAFVAMPDSFARPRTTMMRMGMMDPM